jgi:hypothetical protein
MLKNIPTESQMSQDDLNDPILALIDDKNISMEELFLMLDLPELPAKD